LDARLCFLALQVIPSAVELCSYFITFLLQGINPVIGRPKLLMQVVILILQEEYLQS
jgi:hypothetical protein